MPNLFPEHQPPLVAEFVLTDESNLLIHYLGDVFDWHGYVKFVSLAALRETSRDVPLEKLFVEPSVAPQYLSPDAMDATPHPSTQRVSAALLEHPRLVLLGDPGSGKSTIVNWICTVCSRSTHNPLAGQFGAPLVPVPLVLRELGLGRDFARLNEPGLLWDRLVELFLSRPVAVQLRADRDKHARLEDSLLGCMLETGQAFLLLDGIDEIGSLETRSALRDAVHEGFRRYPRCRWLMTSRVVGYGDIPFDTLSAAFLLQEFAGPSEPEAVDLPAVRSSPAGATGAMVEAAANALKQKMVMPAAATRLYVAPFDDEQVDQFTRLWWAHHESNPHLAGTKPTQFLSALRQSPGARSLGRLPHLLTMIALIYRVRAELPDGRALLYSFIADAYLGTLDKERGLEHLRPIPHGVDEMSRWLAAVAWHLQRQRTSKGDSESGVFIKRQELVDLLSEIIQPKAGDTSRHIAELFIDYVGRRSALLLPRGQTASGDDLYAFLHLSFQEYFAAQFLRDRVADPDWLELDEENKHYCTRRVDLQRYAVLPAWRETLIFLWESAALVSRVFPQRLIERLLDWPRDVSKWGDFAVPSAEQLKPKRPSGEWQPSSERVKLVAVLSVNPHVILEPQVRRSLWERCWRWEVTRGSNAYEAGNFGYARENYVARELLSRPNFASETTAALVRVAAAGQATRIDLNRCAGLTDLAPLARLTELRSIDLADCTSLTDLAALTNLKRLVSLDISRCIGLTGVTAAGDLPALKVLVMDGLGNSEYLSQIARLGGLWLLSLSGSENLTDLTPLTDLSGLSDLMLSSCTKLTNLTPLSKFANLRDLNLGGCTELTELAPLAHLLKLRRLKLYYCPGVTDLSPLAGLTNLKGLDLTGCVKVTDLTPLSRLTKLKTLEIGGCSGLSEAEIRRLQSALPETKIKK